MESAKEKAIREAYGTDYEKFKEHIDENGIAIYPYIQGYMFDDESSKPHELIDDLHLRPKSLQGIETNSDWQRIESEADLPTDGTLKYHSAWFKDGKLTNYEIRPLHELYRQFNVFDSINVYQPIVKPQPPIY